MIAIGLNKSKRVILLLNKEKGFALVTAILIMILLTVMAFGILVVSDTESKIGDNFRSHTQALYIAESGIERVISYFNSPASFTDISGTYSGYAVSSVSDAQGFFAKRRLQGIVPSFFNSSNLSQFEDTDDNGVIDSPPHDYSNPVLKYNRDTNTAQKNFLESISPNVSDQSYIYELMVFAAPPGTWAVATVRVTSKVRNALRTVEQILMPGPIIAFTSGLASGAGASWIGNSLSVHWGSVLIQGTTANLQNPIHKNPARVVDAGIDAGGYLGAIDEDRWLRAFVNGIYTGPPYDYLQTNYANPPTLAGEQNVHPYYTPHYNLFSNQAVTIDTWDYVEAKRIAQRYGTYYSTDAAGNLYLDGKGSSLNFMNITNTKSCGIVFVDTTDQLPPSGGNLATISFSGNYYTSGIFYIAANLFTAGLGTGNTKTVLSPPIIQNVRGGINQGSFTFTVSNPATTAGMKVGDIILIGKKVGGSTVEELIINNVVDATTLTVASTTNRVQTPPGPTPAEFNHNNEDFIITTTTDETTRVSVSGFDYNFSGAIYCAGQVDMQGGPRFFGSIIAEAGYAGLGTPEIWYDWNLSKGELNEYGIPNVVKGAWREIY